MAADEAIPKTANWGLLRFARNDIRQREIGSQGWHPAQKMRLQ